MKDICYIAAFPKSGITYLNFMLFHLLFDRTQDVRLIDSDYIFDVHENLARVPPPGESDHYVKIHFPFGPQIPLRQRAARAIYLLRDPIDVMMSVWDFKHLTGEEGLLDASPNDRQALFQRFCQHWLSTGGLVYPWAGSWRDNVASWLNQKELPLLVVRYERLKADPTRELRRILRFLGRQASEARIAAAIEAGKPDNMRKLETEEVKAGVSGIFFRPGLARGYAQGYRFVGRMHGGSSEKILSPAARQYAAQIFGPILAHASERMDHE
jgi:Sulfotransferase domain